jgi:acetyl esterase/lipase
MNFNKSVLIAISIVFFLLSIASLSAQSVDSTDYRIRNFTYKNTAQADLTLDVYYPAEPSDEALPAIVFFFGGGWVGGNRQHFAPHSQYLASRGMIAITVDYRIRNEHGTTPQQAVMDARSAMRYLKQQAKTLGIDTTRLAAGGGSAGGHLALSTATLHGFDDPSDKQDVGPMPDALVLYNPVVNTTAEGFGAKAVGVDTFNLSPYHRLQADLPPVLIFHGEVDTTVPLENITSLKAKLDALLITNVVKTYAGQGHGFFNLNREEGRYFRETLYQTDLFLQSLGFLKGEAGFQP